MRNLIYIFLLLGLSISTIGCSRYQHLTQADFKRYDVKDTEVDSQSIKKVTTIITPYRQQINAKMNEVIAQLPKTLTKQEGESTLGNWITDAILQYIEEKTGESIDLSICNYFGIRVSSLPAGPLTVGQIYELMPFDNTLGTVKIKGTVLIQLFNVMASNNGWPASKNIKMTVEDSKVVQVKLNGKTIDLNAEYTIALTDYLADGGSNLTFLKDQTFDNTGVYYRDALIEIAKKQGTISSTIDGRIKNLNP